MEALFRESLTSQDIPSRFRRGHWVSELPCRMWGKVLQGQAGFLMARLSGEASTFPEDEQLILPTDRAAVWSPLLL